MNELEKFYQNYLAMTAHLPSEPMSFEEYKKARADFQGIMAEIDAKRILKAEADFESLSNLQEEE